MGNIRLGVLTIVVIVLAVLSLYFGFFIQDPYELDEHFKRDYHIILGVICGWIIRWSLE